MNSEPQQTFRDSAAANLRTNSTADRWTARGIFLVVLAIYVLSSPGRIDIIDSQFRYDVAQNLIRYGRPYLIDPYLDIPGFRILGWDGSFYSNYGLAESALTVPLVWLGKLTSNPHDETSQFLFSLTSCIFGALCAAILFKFYRELNVDPKPALFWTGASAFATLMWPLSASTFENLQRGFFALFAVYLGYLSARRRSVWLALFAGGVAGILLMYRWYMVVLIPGLALSTLAGTPPDSDKAGLSSSPPSPRPGILRSTFMDVFAFFKLLFKTSEARTRLKTFLEGSLLGLVGTIGYNWFRFGAMSETGQEMVGRGNVFHPLTGFLTIFFSPGKSVLLYSPPIILSLLALRYLWRRERWLTYAILLPSLIWLSMMCVTYYTGGDWCWGPRYIVNVLPMWALAFPFLRPGKILKPLMVAIVGLGLAVQLLAVTVDFQRFFLERGLSISFFIEDPWYYFKHSALLARPGEIISLKDGPPESAKAFSPTPYPGVVTYAMFGLPQKSVSRYPVWMRQFQVFYLPRPWPFWMWRIDADHRPVNPALWLAGCLAILTLGGACVYRSLRPAPAELSRKAAAGATSA